MHFARLPDRDALVFTQLDRYSHVMPRLTSALADRMDHAYRGAAPGDTSGDERDAVVVDLR